MSEAIVTGLQVAAVGAFLLGISILVILGSSRPARPDEMENADGDWPHDGRRM